MRAFCNKCAEVFQTSRVEDVPHPKLKMKAIVAEHHGQTERLKLTQQELDDVKDEEGSTWHFFHQQIPLGSKKP